MILRLVTIYLFTLLSLNAATVEAAQLTYSTEESIVVNFQDMSGSQTDWIAIYPKGATKDWSNVIQWKWIKGISQGSKSFEKLPKGEYEVRIFFKNTYQMEDSFTFVVKTPTSSNQAKGLNLLVNSENPQTQMMGMVLATRTLNEHKKEVNIVLCGSAGDLANKNIPGTPILLPNGKSPSAKDYLKNLIKAGASVKVCPLYLPNAHATTSVFLDGITVANPTSVADKLLDKNYKNSSF